MLTPEILSETKKQQIVKNSGFLKIMKEIILDFTEVKYDRIYELHYSLEKFANALSFEENDSLDEIFNQLDEIEIFYVLKQNAFYKKNISNLNLELAEKISINYFVKNIEILVDRLISDQEILNGNEYLRILTQNFVFIFDEEELSQIKNLIIYDEQSIAFDMILEKIKMSYAFVDAKNLFIIRELVTILLVPPSKIDLLNSMN